MKILITGASGMLGSDLCRTLQPHHEVIGVALRSAPHVRVPVVICDLSLLGPLEDLMEDVRPDMVIHAAAMTDVDGCEGERELAIRFNVDVTRNLVKTSNEHGALLALISTDYVFDGKKNGEYLEGDTIRPVNFYGRTKAEAEACVLHEARHFMILRTSWLYGCYGKSFPRTILERAVSQKEFRVVSDQIGRPTYTRDIARGLDRILSSGQIPAPLDRGVFHIAGGSVTSWYGFATGILREAGFEDVRVVAIASSEINRPAKRPSNSVLSIRKTEESFGFAMRRWEEAIKEFIQEMHEQGGEYAT